VLGKDDTIVLKKIEVPSFKGVEKLLKGTREFAKEKDIKESDVVDIVHRARKEK